MSKTIVVSALRIDCGVIQDLGYEVRAICRHGVDKFFDPGDCKMQPKV